MKRILDEHAVEEEPDMGDARAAHGEFGVEIVAGGDARQRLNRTDRVREQTARQILQVGAVQRAFRGRVGLDGLERA